KDYAEKTAPVRGVDVSLKGFKPHHRIVNEIRYIDYSSRQLQDSMTPAQVLDILKEGNQRFRNQHPLPRDLMHQVSATAQEQNPLAIVLSCMDSRTPTEILFDLGLGDVLNVCLAGNAMVGPRVLASVEFGCSESGAKLIVVMAHTGSPVMRQIVNAACAAQPVLDSPHGEHFPYLVENVAPSISEDDKRQYPTLTPTEQQAMCDRISRRHIIRSIETIRQESETLSRLLDQRKVGMIAVMYDTKTGEAEFIKESAIGFEPNGD
ncbi:MAG TPA: sulfate transporter, partial [Planctomycetaceae bacterium]|nr:sulfate transporter [Planctomycetaceae bacterium]